MCVRQCFGIIVFFCSTCVSRYNSFFSRLASQHLRLPTHETAFFPLFIGHYFRRTKPPLDMFGVQDAAIGLPHTCSLLFRLRDKSELARERVRLGITDLMKWCDVSVPFLDD